MSRRPLLAAAAGFAMVIVLGSPFVGALRAAIASAFPGHVRAIIGGAVAVAIGAALVTALARIRDRLAEMSRRSNVPPPALAGLAGGAQLPHLVLKDTGKPLSNAWG